MRTDRLGRRHHRPAFAAIAGVILLTACGSSGSKTGSTTTAPTGSGSTGSGSTVTGSTDSGSTGGSLGDIDICALVPAATAATITGVAVTTTKTDNTPSYKLYSCDYTNDDGTQGFDLSIIGDPYGVPGYDADVSTAKQLGSSKSAVSGIGDKAFGNSSGLEVLYGKVLISADNFQNASNQQLEDLIGALHDKL